MIGRGSCGSFAPEPMQTCLKSPGSTEVEAAGAAAVLAPAGVLPAVSGHPLLVQSALDAVRQWRYQPTLLNGDPVEVDTEIDVIFSLAQ